MSNFDDTGAATVETEQLGGLDAMIAEAEALATETEQETDTKPMDVDLRDGPADTDGTIGDTIQEFSEILAARPGFELCALHEKESSALGERLAVVMVKWLPSVNPGPEMALIITIVGIALPRLLIYFKSQSQAPVNDAVSHTPERKPQPS